MENFVGNLNQMRKFVYNNSFTLINFRVAYNIVDRYKLSFIVNNIMNVEHAHRIGYMGPPRSFELQFSTEI